MKKSLKKLWLLALSLCIGVTLLEGLLTAYAWFKFGTIDVRKLETIQTGDADAAELKPEGSRRSAGYYPHPYLAYVTNRDQKDARINAQGLLGPSFPLRKDPAKFTILVTGGSVAAQFSTAGENGVTYLAQALQKKYDVGREIVVLNGASGGWHQPQQAIMTLLYGEIVDAIVTIDGFNELAALKGESLRLECPADSFDDVNPIARQGFAPLAAAWQAQQLRKLALQYPCRTVYFATRTGRELLRRSVEPREQDASESNLYRLPQEWTAEERTAFNIRRFQDLMLSIDSIADLYGIHVAHFIQPCPAVGKVLTSEEQQVVGKLDYVSRYHRLVEGLMSLERQGVPIVDLSLIFAETRETVYVDTIHCLRDSPTENPDGTVYSRSLGYRIMADRIADQVARIWSIRRRN